MQNRLVSTFLLLAFLGFAKSLFAQCSGNSGFTISTPNCVNQSISFIDTGSATPDSVLWVFGNDNSTYTSDTVNKSFGSALTDTVWLIRFFNTPSFCSDTVFQVFTITDVAASITPSILQNVCIGDSVALTANAGVGLTYQWVKDGADSTGATNNVLYATSPGTYKVRVTQNGCSRLSDSVVVTFYNYPNADFTFAPDTACSGTTVSFANASTGSSLSYNWTFGNGLTSTATNPTTTFDVTGTAAIVSFNVRLITSTPGNCRDTITKTVYVRRRPNSAIDDFNNIPKFVQCNVSSSPFSLQIDNVSTTMSTNNTYSINWGDGNSQNFGSSFDTITHVYATSGAFTMTVITTDAAGCADTSTYTVFNGGNPGVSIGNSGSTSGCRPYGLTFTIDTSKATGIGNNAPGSIYTLTFNDGTAPMVFTHPPPPSVSKTFLTPSCGTATPGFPNAFQAEMSVTNPCGTNSATIRPIYISTKPEAEIDFNPDDDTACLNDIVTIEDVSDTGSVSSNSGCNQTPRRLWNIYPATGWTLNAGYFGNPGNWNNNPANWGSQALQVDFTDTGTFVVELIVGNIAQAGLSVCGDDTIRRILRIMRPPLANFTLNINPTSGCANSVITTNNTSTGDNLTYQWIINPNSGYTVTSGSLTSPTPTFQFNTAGTYYVTLIGSNRCDQDTVVDTLVIRDVPEVTLPGAVAFCGPDTVAFDTLASNLLHRVIYNENFGDSITYQWTVTGGSYTYVSGDSTSYNPSIYLSTPGTYTIKVKITNECGSDSTTQTITVRPLPDANFTINDSAQCLVGHNFAFTDASTISSGTITAYTWTFGDGTGSSAQNPTKSYSTADTFNVQLLVASAFGCVDSITKQVITFPQPTPLFTINDSDQCLNGNSFVFTNTSTIASGSNAYHWRFTERAGDTSILANPTFVYDTTGVFEVKLVVTSDNGCRDSVTRNVYIRPAPEPDFTINDSMQCLNGNSFTFTNTSSIQSGTVSYKWIFSNTASDTSVATSPTKVYTTADTFAVKLIVTSNFGCRDSVSKNVYLFPKPDMAFNVNDSEQCFTGNSFVFTNGSSISSGTISYKWQFSSDPADTSVLNNPTKNYASNGVFPVKLIGTSDQGCKDSVSANMTVFAEPLAGFSINDTDQCINGNNFIFTDTSVVGGLYSRQWTFGDGSGSTIAAPSKSYATADTFIVKLVVTINAGGCKDSVSTPVYVYPQPVAAYTINDSIQCYPGHSFVFTNGTTIASGSNTYLWKFNVPTGTTDTSNLTNPTKNYPASGTYIVRLTATSDKGCKDSTQHQVTATPIINNNVVASNQGLCSGSTPDSLVQSGASVSGGSGAFTYQWQESTDSAVWTNIVGATGVNYQPPALTANRWYRRVVTSGDCADTSVPVKITVTPAITNNTITANQIVCAGFAPSQFNGSTPAGGLGSFTYQWQISTDSNTWNNIVGAQSIDYTSGVLTQTTYFRRLVTSGVCTQPSNVVKVLVNPKPTVSFTTASVCLGLAANYTSTSTITTGSITQYTWTYGDGNGGTGSSQSHTYASVGSYTIKLIAASDSGCTDSTTRTINVHHKPTASFVSNDTCLGFGNGFNASASSVGAGSITNYGWNFGDATTGSGVTTTKTYAAHGSYNVKLIVTTDSSCRDSITQAVVVHPRPVPNFTTNDSDQCVNGNSFTYTNSTSIASGSSTYLWNLGEGATDTSTQTNTSKTYAVNGNYSVKLIATSNFGCIDSVTKPVIVYAKPTPAYSINDTDQCLNGNSFIFTNGSTVNPVVGLSYVWRFGDGSTSTQTNPTKTYSAEGTYTVRLVVTSVNGCVDSIEKTVYVYPKPNPAFTINDTLQCYNGNLFIYTNGSTIASGAQTYFWKLNLLDALDTSTQTNVTKTYTASGNLTVRLTATSDRGCKDSIQRNIIVRPDITNNTIASAQNICSGSIPDTLRHTGVAINGGDGTFTYQWQQSTDSISWSNIGSATSASYASPALFTTTWFRRVAVSGPCSDTSAPIKVTVTPGIGNNIISANQSQCAGFTPSKFNGTVPTGGSGVYTYQWQFSLDSAAWSNITSGTDTNFQAGVLNQTTWYRRLATSNSCTVISNPIKVNVNPKPAASFTAPSVCFGLNATFTSTSTIATGAITQYNWTFGDGNTASGTTGPQNAYGAVGSYTAKLIVTSDSGCVDSTTRTLWVHPKPVASFVYNDTCHTYQHSFNAAASAVASGSITNYSWNFGDATNGSGVTTNKTYTLVNTYNVKLVVTTDSACRDSITQSVIVYPNPVADFTTNDTDQCVNGNNFVFTNATSIASGTVTYGWNFGESATDTSSQTNTSKVYAVNGTYNVGLVAVSNIGCRDTVTKPMTVYAKPAQAFTINDTDQCLNGNSFVFTNTSNITPAVGLSYLWTFDDGATSTQTSPTKTYAYDDTFAVKLVVTSINGCSDSVTQNVYVYPKPLPDFNINDSLQCFGPNLYMFTNQSVINSGTMTHFWRFDLLTANDTSSQTSPTKSYATDGTYTIRLTATSDKGCKDSVENQVTIKPDIINNDIATDQFLCQGETPDTLVPLSGPVSGGDNTFNYRWEQTTDSANWTAIGGATDTLYAPSALSVTTWYRRIVTSGPCEDTSAPVKIFVTPSIGNNTITANQTICEGFAPAQFAGSLPTGGLGVYNYQWQISTDSASWSNIGGATDTSYQSGVLTQTRFFRRRVSSGACPTISNVVKVTVHPKPVAAYTTASVCFGFNANFTSSSTVSVGSIVQSEWIYGDGNTDTGISATNNFTAAGAYTPKLIVTTGEGCKDSTTRPINIHPKPVAAYQHNDTCFDDLTSFDASTSTVATGSITGYNWDLSDGATASAVTASHTYSAVGNYQVKLIVTTDSACQDSITKTVFVHPNPVAAFTMNDSDQCLSGNSFVFTNGSSVASGSNTYNWNFGQSAADSSNQTSPTKVYTASGNYTVRLIAITNFGCRDTATRPTVVYAKPVQAFNINDTDQCINGNSFTFTNTSNITPAVGLTYRWTFGNGDTSVQTSPTKVYTVAGTYPVKLRVTSVFGCADSVTKTVYVYPKPNPAFTINDTLQCFGPNVFTFTNGSTIGSGTINNFWKFDLLNAADTSSQTSPVHTYANDGTFTIRLVTTSDKGCKDSTEKQVTVKPDILNNVINTPQFICEGSTPDTLRQAGSAVSGGDNTFTYQWQRSTDSLTWVNISGATADRFGPPALSVTTWYRRVVNSRPCTDTSAPIKIHVTPAITNNTINSSQTICYAQTPAQLSSGATGGGNGAFTYLWQQSNNSTTWGTAIGTSNTINYQPDALFDTTYYRRRIISGSCTTVSNVLKIAVKPLPVVNWGATTVCYPEPTVFSDSSTVNQGSNSGFSWTFGDGTTSTQQNPSKVYVAGTYTAKLIVTTNFGCRDSLSQSITVHPKPQAGYSSQNNCFGFASTFTDTAKVSSGSVVSWAWAFGDGFTSSAKNASRTYFTHGTYNVRQIVTTDRGCKDTVIKPIVIHPKPTANFGVTTVCYPNSSQFTDSSTIATGSLISRAWDFGDSATSALTNPSHTYATDGVYITKLIVTSNQGCRDSVFKAVTVNPLPTVVFTGDTLACVNRNVFFSNTTSGAASYVWNYGDGNTSTSSVGSNTYANPGVYRVVLVATTAYGCVDSTARTIRIIGAPVPAFTLAPDTGCAPLKVVFTNATTGLHISYDWNFGNGQSSALFNPDTVTYFQSQRNDSTYYITLSATNICGTTQAVDSVRVFPKPVANFTFNVNNGCTPATFTITNTTTAFPDNFIWDLGNGTTSTATNPTSPVYTTVDSVSIYRVRLTAFNHCGTDTISRNLTIYPTPHAAFTAPNNCFGFTSNFTDSAWVGSGSVTNWSWTFGDGNFSSAQSPTNTYINHGTYNVRQIAISDRGCRDTITKPITIYPKPAARFGATTSCFRDSTRFTDSTTVASGSIVSRTWTFGDGNGSTITNPRNLYSNAGTYTAKLIVVSDLGCSDSNFKAVTVNPLPSIAFTGDTVECFNRTIFYTNNSTGAATYVWNYGDGNTSTGSVGSNTFAAPGYYRIVLVGRTVYGCEDSTAMVVRIIGPPTAAFTLVPDTGCAPLNVNFVNNSTGLYTSYDWDFGNGTASTLFTPPTATYIQSRTIDSLYFVTLRATNICATRSVTDTVTVFPKPVANFSINQTAGCSPAVFTVTNNTTAFPQTFFWDFGNGDTSSAQNPPAETFVTGSTISTYKVFMRATNHCGSDTVSTTVTVYPKPVAGFSTQDNCYGFVSNFTDTSKVGVGSITTRNWAFGDGNSSSAQNATHTYFTHGTYNVTQIVVTDRGCRDTTTKPIVIHPKPVANFGVNAACFRDSSSFIDSSTVALGSLTNWVWTFGDGNGSNLRNPRNLYAANGNYNAKLIVTSNQGCRDSIIKPVTVHPLPIMAFTGDTVECFGRTVYYSNTSTGAASYVWNYGDGNTSTGPVGSNTFANPGYYRVVLVGRTVYGCEDSTALVVRIISPPAPAFTLLPDTGCAPLNVNFVNNSTGIYTTYNWNLGNGTTSTLFTPPTATYTQSRTIDSLYFVTLNATNICGTRSVTDTITVFPKPVANFTINQTAGCSPAVFTVTNATTAFPQTFFWDFGNGNTSTAQNPPAETFVTGSTISTYKVFMRATNHCGSDTVSATVTVYPKPVAGFSTQDNCYGFASNFTDTSKVGVGSITARNWAFGDGNGSSTQNPAHTYFNFGTYNVTQIVVTDRGCRDTITKPIVIHPKPVANFGVTTACFRDSSRFTDSSTVALGTLTNWVWTFGDGNGSTLQHPRNLYSSNGNYTSKLIVTSDRGCRDSVIKPVTVHPLPIVAFSGDTLECINRDVFYNNSTVGASTYVWNYGDGKSSTGSVGRNNYTTPGYYRVVLVARTVYGCEDSAAMIVHIIGPPNPALVTLPDTGCAPLQVNFVNNSTGEFTSYDWDFGNGVTSTQFTPPPVTYPQSLLADTAYTVALRATNICATRLVTRLVRVFPKPLANFGTDVNNGCTPKTFTITNTSTAFPDRYYWDFGDGDTSTAQNPPPHTYTTDSVIRTFTIRLRVENKCGFDTVSRRVTVQPKNARSFFGIDSLVGCVPHTIQVTDFSVGATSLSYDFGDGNTSANRNPSHTFNTPGTFIVRQFIANNCTQDTSQLTVTVLPPPAVSFTKVPSTQCKGQGIQFQSQAANIAGFRWDFGNGDTSVLNNPVYSYPNSGTYTVRLFVVSSINGCTNQFQDTITIHAPPVPVLTADSTQGCPPHRVNFSDGSAGSVFVTWKFGDGNGSSVINPTHTYTTTGVYTARMIVRNARGCEDSTDRLIQVHPVPVAAFTQTSTFCDVPSVVNFTNGSTGATGYFWDFGNTLTSANTNPSVTYTNFGIYTTVLRANNQFGCQDTASAVFEVFRRPIPTASLDTADGCPPVEVNFSSNSQFATTYLWDFGDGNTSTQQNPTHTYTTAGTFPVKLKVTSGGACSDSVFVGTGVTVYPVPSAAFTYTFANSNSPNYGEATFIDQSVNANTYLWDFGDGNTSTQPSPTHRYTFTGNYLITQYITTIDGCRDTAQTFIELPFFKGLFVPNAFTPGAGGPDVRTFLPVGISLKTYRLGIYDAWGKLLWETTDLVDTKPAVGWDGFTDGAPCPQDVYVWKVEAEFLDGSIWPGQKGPNGKYHREGTVTLIR